MKKKTLLFSLCLICFVFLLTGCIQIKQILPEQEEIRLAPGDLVTAQINVLPNRAQNKKLSWTSSDDLVATVDQNGKVTAQGVGECTITVQSEKNESVSAQIDVVVLPHVQKIIAAETEFSLKPDQVQTISVQMSPQIVYNDSVKWSSSDETIAKVDQQGTVTACAEGKCIITVQSNDVPGVSAQVEVTVLPPPQSIKVNQESVSLTRGGSMNLSAQVMPENAYDRTLDWKSSNEEVATVDENGNLTAKSAGNCTVTVSSKVMPQISAEIAVTVTAPAYSYAGHQAAGVTYINGILIANKTYALPSDYNPGNNPQAVAALYEMFNAAKQEGITLFVKSGFRSYIDQYIIYNDWVAQDGQVNADRYSARPGHSEHQSGLAFDLNDVSQAFASSPEGIWLAANCHKYGFIIRYPQGKEHITGYIYEPWHVRYLGKELSQKVYDSGLCLEEYLGITSKYAY